MITQVAADLRAAAEVLRRDGWCRWHVTADDGSHCAAGAVNAALPSYGDLYRRVAAYDAVMAHTGHGIIQFNDYVAKDADEVIAALLAAADAAEAQS